MTYYSRFLLLSSTLIYFLMTPFITTHVSSYIGTFCVLRHDYTRGPGFNTQP
jgi:hypothetical protein